jgi:hypothetical protein
MLPMHVAPVVALQQIKTFIWSHDRMDSLRYEGKCKTDVPDISEIQDRDIVLMHDDNPLCLDEVAKILSSLQRRGMATTTLGALFQARRSKC